ncbi:MAG: cyclic peptide export ABC transporter [Pseudomonadota bacterium]
MSKPSAPPLSIFTLLYRHSPRLLVFSAALGAVAGAMYSLIIPFVLAELARQGGKTPEAGGLSVLGGHGALAFFAVCVLILVAKVVSIILVNNIAKSATGELRLTVAKRVGAMTTDGVEAFGFARLLNVLVDDVNVVASAAVTIPMLMVSSVTVLGMLAYLATLNVKVFLLGVAAIALGVTMFQVPLSIAAKVYKRARSLRDVIQEGVRGLITGVYELKLDSAKAARYHDEELAAPQRESVRLEKIGDAMYHLAGTASDLLSFFVIGVMVYLLPNYVEVPPAQAYGIVMAMLYIAGPIAGILSMMRQLQMGSIAVARIAGLGGHLEEIDGTADAGAMANWKRFGVREVSYRYPQADAAAEAGFALAPATLEFKRGQINFIVGGNGSGKSTLSKLISLHYKPASGSVYFDGQAVDAGNLLAARSRLGVIFSNYYLFRKLYRPLTGADQVKIDAWLDALALRGKTEFVDGQFSTTKLSDGQRRRLALLVALLEDRDIYVFDEWAADQDPAFKQVFYRDILQEMKRNNKLVIVITHDDRYFDCADRVIFMDSGRVTEVREQDCAPAPIRACA